MPRTQTAPPTDKGMWRKLLFRAHPDQGGDDALFVWANALREHVAGDAPDPPRASPAPRRRGPDPDVERVPFPDGADFGALTRRALDLAREVPEPFGRLLVLLSDYEEGHTPPLVREQTRGASYRRLAAIEHAAGMGKSLRVRWYRIAESVPLSDRHAKHILDKLKGTA